MLGQELLGKLLAAMQNPSCRSVIILQRRISSMSADCEIMAALAESFHARLSTIDPQYLSTYKDTDNLETISYGKGEYAAILDAVRQYSRIIEIDLPVSPCSCVLDHSENGQVQKLVADIKQQAQQNAKKTVVLNMLQLLEQGQHFVIDSRGDGDLVNFSIREQVRKGALLHQVLPPLQAPNQPASSTHPSETPYPNQYFTGFY